ncbi:MAG: Fic family protein [Alphaproteobacteria bacterium]|nr:Fic family protein [Alphaproteobacteria bacterium]
MLWNWQQKDWPEFTFDSQKLDEIETKFQYQSGVLFGTLQHIQDNDKTFFITEIMSDEAIRTSEIEGEYLNRESVQSSIQRNFGLAIKPQKMSPSEWGISEMMIDLYNEAQQPLTHQTLFNWHEKLTNGRRDLKNIGQYRTDLEPMQIVSGYLPHPKVHFEAPPAPIISNEMNQYIEWFNIKKYRPLTHASIAHLYFECIHPFEDGNGRIGRALVVKSLSHALKYPVLIAFSHIINKNKKKYYEMLELSNKKNEITEWILYFGQEILKAFDYTQNFIEFLIKKTKFYDKFRGQFNVRQEKVIERIFKEGIDGFKGGLSAENYIRITETSRATATRDLQDLVNKGALSKEGNLKNTRYYLKN